MEDYFYKTLADLRDDSLELRNCVKATIDQLTTKKTSSDRPGMLLGKIQSGKTRTYLGIIASAFDNGFDIAIVFQKGTKVLSKQTLQRIKKDFKIFIDDDLVQVFDIMLLHDNMSDWELNQKIVIVVKKQADNLLHIKEALTKKYPNLKDRKILIVDDEADFASICFRKNSEKVKIEQGKIATQIDDLRNIFKESQYLQVTATPYSLYLQPNDSEEQTLFKPKRPAFTILLSTFPGYVGGEHYFQNSEDENSVCHFIFQEISLEERDVLKKADRRSFRLEEVLTSNKIQMLRNAIVNFIVGASIRRYQQRELKQQEKKYSFIIHTEQSKVSHDWQVTIVDKLKSALRRIVDIDELFLDSLIEKSYNNLVKSLLLSNDKNIPVLSVLKELVKTAIKDGHLVISKVNSDKDMEDHLDEKGQLKLRTPLNIFIGGQMLDRGITVENLIGFYYGRNPKKFQQDTVLQHSRMYGARSEEDLAVTRFYSTLTIYKIMKQIYEFDNELRKIIEEKQDPENQGVNFIRKDITDKLVPCSPNKILLSSIILLKPFKRLLPIGFQTDYKTRLIPIINRIDGIIDALNLGENDHKLVELKIGTEIIDLINQSIIFEDEYKWDVKSFLGSMEYLSKIGEEKNKGKIWLLIKKERNIAMKKEDKGYSDSPDTPKTEGAFARQIAIDNPMLMLFRQNGLEDQGWRGSPFWWPVLYAPKNVKTTIFASETAKDV